MRTPVLINLFLSLCLPLGAAAQTGEEDASSVAGTASAEGLVGYWTFDNIRENTAYDDSGTGNDGIIKGAEWAEGMFERGLSFDGNDRVLVPDDRTLDLESWTVSAWVYSRGGDDTQTLVIKGVQERAPFQDWRPDMNYFLAVAEGSLLRAGFGDGTGQEDFVSLDSGETLATNQWQHVAAAYDAAAGQLTVYIDGSSQGVQTGITVEPPVNGRVLVLGAGMPSGSYASFDGILDEVRVYSRALNDAEIRSLAVAAR